MNKKLENLEFADDLVLLSQRVAHARQKFESLQTEAAKVGLKVNASKTKEMRINSHSNTGDIMCEDQALERVESFTYLCSIVTSTGGSEEDVEARCRKAQSMFYMLRLVWRSRYISLWTKLRIFNSNVKSVLLYGSETWRLTSSIIKKLQSFINRRLRYILGIIWPERIANKDLWQQTEQERVEVVIRRRKWKWIGHTLRKPANNTTRQALEWNPQGKRKTGQPKKSWKRTVNEEHQEIGMSWNQIKRVSKNRVRWRKLVEALCSGRSEED